MKKLSLVRMNLTNDDLLQKEQLKSVFGGYSGPYCEGVAQASASSAEAEDHSSTGSCWSSSQYNYAYNYAYNICMNY